MACLLLAVGSVWSQSAKSDSAEAEAAMERAKRLAANPMKVILQAGKIRRKTNEGEAPVEAADATNLRRTAARAAAEPAAQPVRDEPATRSVAAPRPTAEGVVALVVMDAGQLSAATSTEVAPIESAAAAPAVAAMPKLVAPQAMLAAPPVAPKLVTMVEPEVPTRLMSESPRVGEVYADLTLRADGSVAEVVLLAPYPRSWQRYLTAALEKWRFDPLPDTRVHRVQLVFSEQ
jgi:Meckel syndrome type 1 protein